MNIARLVFCLLAAAQPALAQMEPRARDAPRAAAAAAGEQRSTPRVQLARRIAALDLRDVPLEEALRAVAEASGANLFVRWQELEAVGIARDWKISLSLRDARLSDAIAKIFEQIEPGTAPLACLVDGNLLVLSTNADLGRDFETRYYDSAALLELAPALRPQERSGLQAGSRASPPRAAPAASREDDSEGIYATPPGSSYRCAGGT